MSENRVSPRSRTFLPARIEISELGTVANCTIRDISDHGARIQIDSELTLPSSFTLHIPRFERIVRVSLKWRRGDRIGVEFAVGVGAGSHPDSFDQDIRYVKKLEDEIVRLKLLLESIREDPMMARLLLEKAA